MTKTRKIQTTALPDPSPLLAFLRPRVLLVLAPIYVWGWLIAGASPRPRVVLGFVALYIFLYWGANALAGYYAGQGGPTAGRGEDGRPSPAQPVLLPFALTLLGIGWLLAGLVNASMFVVYAVFAGLLLLAMQPRLRLSKRPVVSLLVLGLGQGGLAYLSAWAATRAELRSVVGLDGVLGAAAAVLLVVAIRTLAQMGESRRDTAGGARTGAVAWGASASFALATACLVLGGLALLALVGRRFGMLDVVRLALGLG
jgi:hypothetical protein